MKLYKFRELSLKDQMRIEVDFGGEPVEIDEEEIEDTIWDNIYYRDHDEVLQHDYDGVRKTVKAIIQLLT